MIEKSYSETDFEVTMPDSLFERFGVFQSIFREYKEIIDFQKTFDKDIRANISSATGTLETLRKHSIEMKFRYSNYTRQMDNCLELIKKNRDFFIEIRKLINSGLMLNDELSRPTRGVPNLKLYFTDFIKCAKKDGKNVEAEVYNEMLSVLDNVGKTIDDALILQKIRDLPSDFKIEEQGCCVKSGPVSLIKTHKSLLRKLLGMKASIKFNSGYMFLFEKCLLICAKMKNEGNKSQRKRNKRKEKFQLEALIHVSDLVDFVEDDYYDDTESLRIFEKQTNIAHLINFDSEELCADWAEEILTEVGKFIQMRPEREQEREQEQDLKTK